MQICNLANLTPTLQTLNAEQMEALSEEVGPDRTLLVCCAAFRGDANRHSNLTIKKIPKMVLNKCEWGHDDYSLNVQYLPKAPPETPKDPLAHDAFPQPAERKKKKEVGQGEFEL